MDEREEIRKELEQMAPKLGGLERKNPFKTPDYYFHGLPDKMLDKVRGSESPVLWTDKIETWLSGFFTTIFQPRYAIPAAAFICILAVVLPRLQGDKTQDNPIQLSEISTNEIDSYIFANLDDYDLGEIELTSAEIENGIIPDNITKEELNDFFNNSIDNQTFEEEFL